MSCLRERDKICFRFCKIQARVFERSAKEGIPSYFFLKAFLATSYVRKMDEVTIFDDIVTEGDIYRAAASKVKTRKGTVIDPAIMAWIGYLLREWAYRYKTYTSLIMGRLSLKYLCGVYPAYHSLDILKAIEKIALDKGIDLEEKPEARLRSILLNTMPQFRL